MGTCLVIVKKSYGGVTFVNTHAVNVNDTAAPMTQVEMQQILEPPFLDNTGVLLPGPVNSIIWSILEFERQMYSNLVRFERVLLTDKRNYQEGADEQSAFKGKTLNYNGASNRSTANSIDAGDHILSITRTALGVSGQDGEIEYRMLLNKEDHRAAGDKLLAWADDQARIRWGTALTDALDASGLAGYFGTGFGLPDTNYVIPRYTDKNAETTDSDILGFYYCEGFAVLGPLARQVRKGRTKKKKTPTP